MLLLGVRRFTAVAVVVAVFFFFFKQKTAYEIGTGDWSSDVCSSDLFNIITLHVPPAPSRPM